MKTSRKILLIAAVAGLAVSAGFTANAQLFTYTGTSTSPSSSVVNTSTTASTTTSAMTTTPMSSTTASSGNASTLGAIGPTYTNPPATVSPLISTLTGSWIEFNGLIVTNISGTVAPLTITANGSNAICEQFDTQTSALGTAETCPMNTNGLTVQVTDTTSILLRNRDHGVIANITSGDEINIFGFYGTDGTIQAAIVRDLSKPQIGVVPVTGTLGTGTGTGTINNSNGNNTTLSSLLPNLNNSTLAQLSNLSATITQMNSDGSFVVSLSNGETFTIPAFLHVGETITFSQAVNWIENTLTHFNTMNGNSTTASTTY